ncbi:MAG: lamin tail domain-containing protein, partial [Verrucomicrobiales bacterium]
MTLLSALTSFAMGGREACAFTLGNDPAAGGTVDGWSAILIVDENDSYTNETATAQSLTLTQFNFNAGAARGRVTPFLVKVNANDNFTVLAIGRTRVSAVDFPAPGVFSHPFADTAPVVVLNPGDTIAPGFTDANPDGTGNAGSVIPFGDGGDELWLTGGSASSNAGRISVDTAPSPGGTTFTTLTRQYAFNIELTVGTPEPQAPTGISLSTTSLFPGTAPGSAVGSLTTQDPNPHDTHTYALLDDAGGHFALQGATLHTARTLGTEGSTYTVRVRSTDQTGLPLEAALTLGVVAPRVRLNEFLASNDTGLRDENGSREDWIELHNPLDTSVNLLGWRLTDDPEDPARWVFPNRTLAPGAYLVVFASGKNRAAAEGNLHTNFRLDGSRGDFLALVRPDGVVADSLDARPQFSNLAYGLGANGIGLGYLTPTANAPNGPSFAHGLNEVQFSVKRGFYTEAQTLTLTADVPGSVIRYTVNGTRPTATSGLTYEAPIVIAPDTGASTRGTKRIRAVALHPEAAANRIGTHTYLFVNGVTSPATDGILGQTNSNSTTQTNAIKNNPVYGPLLGSALTALSTVSINLASSQPSTSESTASVEFFHPSGTEPGFHIDCGIQAVGNASVGSPKNNFRLYFRSQYGQPSLNHTIFRNHPYTQFHQPAESFDRIALRSGSHDSFFWMAETAAPPMSGVRGDALYMRAALMDDFHLNFGHVAPHNRYVQLWLNGRYHGLYHWREYPNNDFLASYRRGSSDDFDFTNGASASENGSATWQTTWSKIRAAIKAGYGEAARWIDLPHFADFMILNFWAGNAWDWNPNQNWMAAGPKLPDRGGWTFFSYDNDVIWNDLKANLTIPTSPHYVNNPRPGIMPPDGFMVTSPTNDVTLMDHAEFKILFRDRFYKACFHGGPLDTPRAQSILDRRVQEIALPIIAETARWQPGSATRLPWDRDGEWMAEVNRLRNTFIPARVAEVRAQIKARGWYPVEAPEFSQHGGSVAPGTQPTVASTTPGTEVYATLDGSDPRLPGGAIHPSALLLADPLPAAYTINGPVLIRLRARRTTDGEWSALNEAAFHVGAPAAAGAGSLIITEIHYHPDIVTDPDDAEFLELMNISPGPIDLSGCYFTRGLDYVFPSGSWLDPGERLVVTAAQFLNGTALSNAGER